MTYNLFISHSWTYGDAYDRLVDMLNAKPYFSYKNYSVPKYDPIHNVSNDYQLKEAIRRQMQPATCKLHFDSRRSLFHIQQMDKYRNRACSKYGQENYCD